MWFFSLFYDRFFNFFSRVAKFRLSLLLVLDSFLSWNLTWQARIIKIRWYVNKRSIIGQWVLWSFFGWFFDQFDFFLMVGFQFKSIIKTWMIRTTNPNMLLSFQIHFFATQTILHLEHTIPLPTCKNPHNSMYNIRFGIERCRKHSSFWAYCPSIRIIYLCSHYLYPKIQTVGWQGSATIL